MKNEKMIEKLKKLFALGQSPNQHEAEAAMAKANEIMTEYQISATDVDLADDGDVVRQELELGEGKQSTWIQSLAMAAAKLYDGKCFYAARHDGPGLKLRFYGTKADILAAQMTFQHLYGSWKSIVALELSREAPMNTRTYKRAHGMGFTSAIDSRVKKLVQERQAKVKTATGRDLVVVKGAAVDNFLKDKKIGRKTSAPPRDTHGFASGYQRGQDIPLHGSLEKEKPLMIGKA